jgi:hypothetical protein
VAADGRYADVLARGGAGVAEAGVPPPRVATDDAHRRMVCLGSTEQGSVLHAARDEVARACREWGVAATVGEVAMLLTSEIVANAAEYGHPPCHLVVEAGQDRLVVSCQDCSSELPIPRQPDVGRPGGRGLMMLQKLAARWGYARAGADGDNECCRFEPHKQVWFVMLTE